ncbi:uncharacterized protein LOC113508461 [Trichoplusia ni]|uniref:Uncharacterized protein LOC113508461 n=1 Tax=Trichoplusia ni TaxID=7111 RepID=A0A7E5X295_TRINI|nr:uncharacterized protein LOC113508461 [Trichoplusia ni]
MEDETTTEGTETPTAAAGDVEEGKHQTDTQDSKRGSAEVAQTKKDHDQEKPAGEGELADVLQLTDDETKSEAAEGGEVGETDEGATEDVAGEHELGEYGEEYEEYYVEEEIIIEEQIEEVAEGEEKAHVEGEEVPGEGAEEHVEGEESEKKEEDLMEELGEEEQAYPEEPPPDPAAPYNFSDSKEALKAPFELRPDQLAEVEQIWEMYQNYTPAYSDLDGWVTEKELVYMLNCLLLMTYTAEQLQELITYCCRPPNAKGHIFYEQFLKMVTIRQRDFPIEEEIRAALQVYDPEKTGIIDRDYLKELLMKHGHKMAARHVDNLIKEVDMSNDGTIGVEDVVGTMCLDLNKEDLQMLRAAVNPPDTGGVPQQEAADEDEDDDDD